ncbi:hypothetical protein BKA67DRAFT_133723 [Truncatella angustata]|uniref:Uncharacterized protein n=1 Tax=Truncatella angustata TaxID=152316 RepID=A0A9P8RFB2_9PEZI|nr:uncharacterized protein BKA67DRAFT_133723 [Truncatella angustata]KAH6643373.1 hypothetical protein BKA67DRAFT_133723 [Truncatella angustata]
MQLINLTNHLRNLQVDGHDDNHYNASANELWDSFWPAKTETTTADKSTQDKSKKNYFQPSPSRTTRAKTVSKPTVRTNSYHRHPGSTPPPIGINVAPRIPSISRHSQYRPLRGSKSFTNTKSEVSNLIGYLAPTTPELESASTWEQPRPAPIPKVFNTPKLRMSASAHDIREWVYHDSQALLGYMPINTDQIQPTSSQMERFISVFDSDSDAEYIGNYNTSKRGTRNLRVKKDYKGSDTKQKVSNLVEKETATPRSESSDRAKGGKIGRAWYKLKRKLLNKGSVDTVTLVRSQKSSVSQNSSNYTPMDINIVQHTWTGLRFIIWEIFQSMSGH